MTPALQTRLADVLEALSSEIAAPARRARAPGCGRQLGEASMVSAEEVSLETGHGVDRVATLLEKRKHLIEHTEVRHGKGKLTRWLWRQARTQIIRELGGGGLPGQAAETTRPVQAIPTKVNLADV